MGRRSSDDLRDDLSRWVAAGLIDAGQADAIAAHDAALEAPQGGVSVLAEALGYAGAALALAGIFTAVGNMWDDLASPGRLAVVTVPTLLLVAAGWALRPRTEAAFVRLMSLLWFMSIGGFAGTAGVVLVEFVDVDWDSVALIIGLAMAVPAFILWRLHRGVLQQVALLVAVTTTMLGVFSALPGRANGLAMVVAAWALGIGWTVLGRLGVLTPPVPTMVLGSLLAGAAPAFGSPDHEWLLIVGVATGAASMALSIPVAATALLVIGTVGVFGYVTSIVLRFFGDQLGVPLALTIIGAAFIALALLAARLGRFSHRSA